ncbi:MAG TPA: hypothetical protein VJU58_17165, partial [Microbacterium sp.]|nr:hypothetical protein [Microbacterium sp.]
ALVGILLLFGIARTILRMRRRRRGTDAAAPGSAEGETPEDETPEVEGQPGAAADEAGVRAATEGNEE